MSKEKMSDAEFHETAKKMLTDQKASEQTAAPKSDADAVIDLAADTLTGDIRDAILDWRKAMGKPWAACNEDEQSDEIHRARDLAENLVKKACVIIASQGKKAMQGTLESVTVKDGIKAVIKLSKMDEQRHSLLDAQGHLISMVFADSQPFKGERAPAEPVPDQGTLLDNAEKLKGKKDKVTALRRKDTHGDDGEE